MHKHFDRELARFYILHVELFHPFTHSPTANTEQQRAFPIPSSLPSF